MEGEERMRVRMLTARRAYPHGTLVQLHPGDIVELPDELAESWVERGRADATDDPITVTPPSSAVVDETEDETPEPVAQPAGDPLDGLNAKQAVAAIADFTTEQLDAIPAEEDRKTVLDAAAARRAELERA